MAQRKTKFIPGDIVAIGSRVCEIGNAYLNEDGTTKIYVDTDRKILDPDSIRLVCKRENREDLYERSI